MLMCLEPHTSSAQNFSASNVVRSNGMVYLKYAVTYYDTSKISV